jgi:hypothetical protein
LLFGSDDPVLHGYTVTDYAGDVDSMNFTFGYMMTYVGEQHHGNQGCKNVFHCQPQMLST